MQCEICNKETYVIHIDYGHRKVCCDCFEPIKKNNIEAWETDPRRYCGIYT